MENESKALIDESIRLGELLESLKKNKAFKELILEGFISKGIDEIITVMPYANSDEQRRRCYSKLEAIANLKKHLNDISNTAKGAKECLERGTVEDLDSYNGV